MEEELNEEQGGLFLAEPVVKEAPELDVDIGGNDAPSLSEAEEDTVQQTDLQAAIKSLLPQFADERQNKLLRPVMVSRVFADNFLDLNFLLNMCMIEEHEDDADIDFAGIVTGNQAATSIGWKGEGRIDILEIAGVMRDEELQKNIEGLGLSG